MERCSRVKDGNGRVAQGEDAVKKIWKEYFEDLYNIDTHEQEWLISRHCGTAAPPTDFILYTTL